MDCRIQVVFCCDLVLESAERIGALESELKVKIEPLRQHCVPHYERSYRVNARLLSWYTV